MHWISTVLGHGLRVEATPATLSAAVMACLPPGGTVPIARLSLRLDPTLHGPARGQVGVHRWLLLSGGAHGVVDSGRTHARVAVGPGLLADRVALRHDVVDPAVLFLVTSRDRVPLHAAALARGGRALVLAGAGGVGKSTLTWMAAQGGVTVLAEDVIYVQRHPHLVVHGRSRYVHLRPDGAHRLGASGAVGAVQRAGVTKLAFRLPVRAEQGPAEPHGLVLLARGTPGRLRPLAIADVVDRLRRDIAPGFDRFAPELAEIIPCLAGHGAWQLEVDEQPERSFAQLHSLLDRLLPA